MLEYGRIDVPQGTDVNKKSSSKQCNIFHYWYFLNKRSKLQPYVCNECHGLTQKAMSPNNVTIVSVVTSVQTMLQLNHSCYMS